MTTTDTYRALETARHALAAARQALTAHEAQTPTDADAWGDAWAKLTGRAKACERMAEQAQRAHQQAQAELHQQQIADWYTTRDRHADGYEATFGPKIEAANAALRAALEQISQIDQEREAWIADVWAPHAQAAQQLREIPIHEYQIRRMRGHGEISVPALYIPRSGRTPPLL